MSSSYVHVEQKSVENASGVVAHITIDRPKALNALNQQVLSELSEALRSIDKDVSVRVVCIRGAGDKTFVAGADIAAMRAMEPAGLQAYIQQGQQVMSAIEQCRVPVIALVDGYALGGGFELALACDLIVAHAEARLGLPEVTLGLMPGFGGTQRLIQRAGIGAARRMIFTGDMVKGSEAFDRGMVDVLFEESTWDDDVADLVEGIASRAPLALSAAKRTMFAYEGVALAAGLQKEIDEFVGLFSSKDAEEGVNAFLEKRKAQFNGH